MIAPRDFAVWLKPEPAQFAQLENCMAKLRSRHGGLLFPPHMTLCSGKFWSREELLTRFSYAMAREQALEISVMGVGTSAHFFQTLFLEMEHSAALTDCYARVQQRLDSRSRHKFNPHVSLLYKETDARQRERLTLDVELEMPRIRFTETLLVMPGNPQMGWSDVAAWKMLGTMTLAPSADISDGT